MRTAHTAGEVRIGDEGTRSGNAPTPGVAGLFALAAAPVFAVMAVWGGWLGRQPDMLYMGMQGPSPMSGMTLMYALMSVFHLPPWLKLIANRWIGAVR